jgi:hypothetical protein
MLSISQKLIQHDKQFKYLSDKIHELDNISQTIQNPIQNPIQNLPYIWVQKGMDIDGEATDDYSGYSVSLSADGLIVAIGAYQNDGINGSNSGHVRVYEWDGMSMYIQKGIDIDGEAQSDYSGQSVSLSADGLIVAIGAIPNDGINGNDSGHVRVYEWIGSASNETVSWVQKGIDIDGEAISDWSGYSVSLSADGLIVAIGAYQNDGINGASSGHVRVYEWNGVSMYIQKGIDIDGEAIGDWSGYSVSLSADGLIVAIGARRNDTINGNDSGHVRVYEWDGMSMYIQKGIDIDGEAQYDWSGFSVSLSADGLIVAIGAHQNDGINSSDSGHVRVHRFVYV